MGLIDNEDLINQKKACIRMLDGYINQLEENAEESEKFLDWGTVEIGITSLRMLYNCLNAQQIKEPLDDVVFFAGMAELDSPCYHVLVRPEDRRRMEKDPNISMCSVKCFTGVMMQDNKRSKKLNYINGKAFCGECEKRVYPRFRPWACRKCGTLIDWSDEAWYQRLLKEENE